MKKKLIGRVSGGLENHVLHYLEMITGGSGG
jgi:hypothetical protein